VQPEERIAYLLREARSHDPDRYLCALLAPADRREALLALTLFNHELARIPEAVTQPVSGMIRYQWWREALDEMLAGGPPRRHPVVEALADPLAGGRVDVQALHALIDAREPALDRPAPDAGWLAVFAAATSGELARMWYRALGGTATVEADGAAAIGTAFGLIGLERGIALEAARNVDRSGRERLESLKLTLRARAAERLREGRRLAGRPAREHMAAFLLAPLADGYLTGRSGPLERGARAPLTLTLRALLRRP
jgi:15-cis-phytoene synthase